MNFINCLLFSAALECWHFNFSVAKDVFNINFIFLCAELCGCMQLCDCVCYRRIGIH